MERRLLSLIAMCLLAAGTAVADVKVYSSTPPGGLAGDVASIQVTGSPPVQTTPGVIFGGATITDTGTGTVTLNDLLMRQNVFVLADLTGAFGPGAFLFIDADTSITPTAGQTGAGNTDKGTGSIAWGVLSGWTQTGPIFCLSSPFFNCSAFGVGLHGVTISPNIASSTYDIGTWTFDAEGDYEAEAYIVSTFNGGTANAPFTLRGRFVGAGIPALPLLGFGVLAAGLVLHGVSIVRRKK